MAQRGKATRYARPIRRILPQTERRVAWLLAAIVATFSGRSAAQTDSVTLTVSAASSLTDAFESLSARFTDEYPQIIIRLNFGGSNHLQRQIEASAGRGIDLFASAGAEPMDALEEAGLIDSDSRVDFAGNSIVLISAPGNPIGITSFNDLGEDRVRQIAVGAANVPIGRYGRQVLRHLGLLERLRDKFVEGIHVRQVADYVARGEVSAALVYATDATELAQRVDVVARAAPEWHEPIRYPVAILTDTPHAREAGMFIAFVASPAGAQILAEFGFLPPPIGRGVRCSKADATLSYAQAWTAMKLSLIAATGALIFVFPVGTALGALLAKRSFPGRELLDAFFTLPMVLPPTVVGYYLILALGARSPAGHALDSWFGVRVSLTLLGATVASAVIALPLMVKSARAAFESVDREYEYASYTLGKGKIETLFRVTLPLARSGLMAGAILSFARAIGEFGATFMLAGIIPGQTMTMPVAIFHAFTNHEDRTVQILVLILTVFSVLVIYATNRLNARQLARMRNRGA